MSVCVYVMCVYVMCVYVMCVYVSVCVYVICECAMNEKMCRVLHMCTAYLHVCRVCRWCVCARMCACVYLCTYKCVCVCIRVHVYVVCVLSVCAYLCFPSNIMHMCACGCYYCGRGGFSLWYTQHAIWDAVLPSLFIALYLIWHHL